MIIKCAGVILDNKKLLVVRKKHSKIFISPGGKVEDGESLEECVVRELMEEINVDAECGEFMGTYTSKSAIENEDITLHAWYMNCNGQIAPNSEIEEIRWINWNDITGGLEVGSIFLDHIIPELKQKDLID